MATKSPDGVELSMAGLCSAPPDLWCFASPDIQGCDVRPFPIEAVGNEVQPKTPSRGEAGAAIGAEQNHPHPRKRRPLVLLECLLTPIKGDRSSRPRDGGEFRRPATEPSFDS